jgi:hypothetical protein
MITVTYDQAALASGHSKRFFVLNLYRAIVTLTALYLGAVIAGMLGLLVGMALAGVVIYPANVWLARRQGVWDPVHDAIFGVGTLLVVSLLIWVNFDALAALAAFSGN